MNVYPRESVEFQPVDVKVDGQPVTTGVQLAVTGSQERPTAWTDPVLVDGRIGVMVQGLAVGYWYVWARITASPETPVVLCGSFQVS